MGISTRHHARRARLSLSQLSCQPNRSRRTQRPLVHRTHAEDRRSRPRSQTRRLGSSRSFLPPTSCHPGRKPLDLIIGEIAGLDARPVPRILRHDAEDDVSPKFSYGVRELTHRRDTVLHSALFHRCRSPYRKDRIASPSVPLPRFVLFTSPRFTARRMLATSRKRYVLQYPHPPSRQVRSGFGQQMRRCSTCLSTMTYFVRVYENQSPQWRSCTMRHPLRWSRRSFRV